MAESDLIVQDESYEGIVVLYSDISELMETRLNSYIEILGTVCSEGIVSGNVHDNLVLYGNKIVSLSGQVQGIIDEVRKLCGTFVEEIDSADSYLY